MRDSYVVVGAGLAGVRATEALRSEGFDGRIVLVGAEPHLPYDRPPLSKEFLLAQGSHADILLQPESFYTDNEIELSLGTPVSRLLTHERSLLLEDGRKLLADRVLLCTGGSPIPLRVPGAELEGVHYLRRLEDAQALQDQLTIYGSVVVIGAGFIGAEVASSARERGCPVTLIELGPAPLAHAVGPEIGAIYRDLHRERGVDLRTDTGVTRISGPDRVWEVSTTDGETMPADVVVVGIGTRPETRLAEEAGIATDDGVLVDEYGRTSNEGVFAAGDVARRFDPPTGRHVRFEHWQSAQNHAIAVARSMLGRRVPFVEVPWFWSDQFDVNLQTAGVLGGGDAVVVRGEPSERRFSTFFLKQGRLIGIVAVNQGRDVRPAITLIDQGAPVDPKVLSDPTVDLRRLAREAEKASSSRAVG